MQQVVDNAAALAEAVPEHGLRLVSGGTDNHLMLVDLTPVGISGRKAERILEEAGITANKNAIPNDPRPPMQTSGVRLGTPAMTTRGLGVAEMAQIGAWIGEAVRNHDNPAGLEAIRDQVREMAEGFPLPGVSSPSQAQH